MRIGVLFSLLTLSSLLACCADSRRSPAAEKSLFHTASQLPPDSAYVIAVDLQRRGHHLESIDYFRRSLVGHEDVAQLHLELGQALHNASLETDLSLGFVRFVVPRSQDRLAMTRDALAEIARAVTLAPTEEFHSYALFIRARILMMWGLKAEALEAVIEARHLVPQVDVLRHLESQCLEALDGTVPGRNVPRVTKRIRHR